MGKKSKATEAEVLALFNETGDVERIAKHFGLSSIRIRRILSDYRKSHGIPNEPRVKVSDVALQAAWDGCNGDPAATAAAIGISVSQVNRRIRRIRLTGGSSARPTIFEQDPENPDVENRIDGVRKRAGIPLDAIRRVTGGTSREWGMGIKNADGQWEEHGLYGTTLKWTVDTPEFPLIQYAETHKIYHIEPPRILRKVKSGVVVSDAQVGYLRDLQSGELEPSHDPRALEVVRQVIAAVAPSQVIWIGDWMDWPVFSRWAKIPEYWGVTQPSIQAGYEWKSRFIAAAPSDCEHYEVGSNHMLRPEKFIQEYNREASGLTRAVRPGDKGAAEWPVFSEPYLLHYDELGIKFTGQYPGGDHYIFDDLVAMHAPPKNREYNANVIHGHTHKLTVTPNVIHGRYARRGYLTWDTGCLCRVDVTTNAKRLLVTMVPSDRGRTDWHQGFAHFEYMEVNGVIKHDMRQIRIDDGAALYRGDVFDGTSVSEPWLTNFYFRPAESSSDAETETRTSAM